MVMNTKWLNTIALILVVVAVALVGFKNIKRDKGNPILNVSYDPTRELYNEINQKFIQKYEDESGTWVGVEQSHGGSTRQAKAVVGGLAADVVTLALPSDIETLVAHGLVNKDWQTRFPNHAQPYSSTIVFVVRKSNPKHIRDWPDLIVPDITVITPDPRTSGNGKLSFLAGWGSVIYRGGSEEQARDFIRQLYEHVPVLGQGARDSTTTFALEGVGDVHLTWENEAIREVNAAKGEFELVYPPVSIRAEPSVALVDANVDLHKSASAAKAYLDFLYTDQAQEILAKNGYRPFNEEILKKHKAQLPDITLFPVTLLAKDWSEAQIRFFEDNGIFETIRKPNSPTHSANNQFHPTIDQ
jgi:sulfate transport system substrate-binding protein